MLDAVWELLVEGGYQAVTFDAVAERAGTSKPVIYRRWRTRGELVVAAVQHAFSQPARPVPDTGTLRGDVIALLTQANEAHSAMAAVISVQLAAYYQENETTPAELRERLLEERASVMETVLARAVDRGEIPTASLPARIIALPSDLLRQESLMTLKPVPTASIIDIVDEVFLPLVRRHNEPPRA